MRLVYKATGLAVTIGDHVEVAGQPFTVDYFTQPHKPASEGKVTVLAHGQSRPHGTEFYVSVIGAEWIEREDRGYVAGRQLILNKPQAEAVYNAMCALNNVGGTLEELILRNAGGTYVVVCANNSGTVRLAGNAGVNEFYRDQAAFATAYGLS